MEFNFEQNQTVEALDKVPEDFRPFYVEGEDKKFKIDDRLRKATAAIDGLNKTAKTLRGGEKELKALVDGFKKLGATPEEVETRITELNAQLTSKEKINPEKIKEEITKAFQGQLKEKDDIIASKDKAINRYLVTSQATAAIAEAKGIPELLLPHVERQVKVVESGGDYKAVVVDSAGDTRYAATGSEMTVADLVKSMRADPIFSRAFESEAGGGGGSNANNSQRKVVTKQVEAPKSSIDKIASGLAKRAAGQQ